MIKTTDYEIVDYGIENEQCFQGHGTSFTNYNDSCLGIGNDYNEALNDALECAATMGIEIELSLEDQQTVKVDPNVLGQHMEYCEEEDHSDCEHYLNYYVGLRWN